MRLSVVQQAVACFAVAGVFALAAAVHFYHASATAAALGAGGSAFAGDDSSPIISRDFPHKRVPSAGLSAFAVQEQSDSAHDGASATIAFVPVPVRTERMWMQEPAGTDRRDGPSLVSQHVQLQI